MGEEKESERRKHSSREYREHREHRHKDNEVDRVRKRTRSRSVSRDREMSRSSHRHHSHHKSKRHRSSRSKSPSSHDKKSSSSHRRSHRHSDSRSKHSDEKDREKRHRSSSKDRKSSKSHSEHKHRSSRHRHRRESKSVEERGPVPDTETPASGGLAAASIQDTPSTDQTSVPKSPISIIEQVPTSPKEDSGDEMEIESSDLEAEQEIIPATNETSRSDDSNTTAVPAKPSFKAVDLVDVDLNETPILPVVEVKEVEPEEPEEIQETPEEAKKRKLRERMEAWKKKKAGDANETAEPPVAPKPLVEEPPVVAAKVYDPAIKMEGFSLFSGNTQVETGVTAMKQNTVIDSETLANRVLVMDDDEEEMHESLNKPKIRLIKFSNDSGPVKRKDTPMDIDETDVLDEFMVDIKKQAAKLTEESENCISTGQPRESLRENEKYDDYGQQEPDEEDILAMAAKKMMRKKEMVDVDHSTMNYEPFRKEFYIETPEMANMTPAQVKELRLELDGIKVRGLNCPKPIKTWSQCGLNVALMKVLKAYKYDTPTPIQAQALPAIMSGRDVIGVAKTGSGKTLAFLLPMFRHIKDQKPVQPQDGPIAIIMSPTRELVVQIYNECRKFAKPLNLRVVRAYGGSAIKEQIAELKRGAEIVVCTPGRMIDLLSASGKATNLRRCTYLVLDEADRMFDMGFDPQVTKIVSNIRPDRQTVLFSATFPRRMEALARRTLQNPIEIAVGEKSIVCDDVEQKVEVIDTDKKFYKLLEILGQWGELDQYSEEISKKLIFVERKDAADELLQELIVKGYNDCSSLHGGRDQADRESTLASFKSSQNLCNILIATSVAARGLDVKNLKVVVNYEVPNHMEDYIHRCGRTGRAGNKGVAYTFISPEEDRHAGDIIKAMKASGAEVPEELLELWKGFQEKVKSGDAEYSSGGFGGKGLEKMDRDRELMKKAIKKTHNVDDDDDSENDMDDDFDREFIRSPDSDGPKKEVRESKNNKLQETLEEIHRNAASQSTNGIQVISEQGACACEIEINDYPQKARWRVTNKETISQITERTGAAITTRGSFIQKSQAKSNERKLYLFIEGETEYILELAKSEIRRILSDTTLNEPLTMPHPSAGKYSVL